MNTNQSISRLGCVLFLAFYYKKYFSFLFFKAPSPQETETPCTMLFPPHKANGRDISIVKIVRIAQ
jgi:hypothetical protein